MWGIAPGGVEIAALLDVLCLVLVVTIESFRTGWHLY